MRTKVIYLHPDCEYDANEFERLTDEEKLCVAKNSNEMDVYYLESFQIAFNLERISDLGYIYFVNV